MKNLISVVGPTGIGKTKLAIDLAKHFNTELFPVIPDSFLEK
jgi:tRNA dimethylallyltransferase